MLGKYLLEINKTPIRVKQHINAIDKHKNDYVMTGNRKKPSITNNLNKIHLISFILKELPSTFYGNKNEGFEFLFRLYTGNSVNSIDHQYLIQEQKPRKEKAYYESNTEKFVYKPPYKRGLNRIFDEKYWPKIIHKEVIWFQFQVVIELIAKYKKESTNLLH